MTQKTSHSSASPKDEAHTDYLSTGAQIATISTFLILLVGLFTAWLTKKIRSAMRDYTERLSNVEQQLANAPIVKDKDSSGMTIDDLRNAVDNLLIDIENRMETAISNQKQNSRVHIKNEVEALRKEFFKEVTHLQELIDQKLKALEDTVKDGKKDILSASEQAMTAQLTLSDVQARLDMINSRLNSGS